MRGIAFFNFPAFHTAAAALRKQGHEVFSPAEADMAHYGVDVSKDNFTGSETQAEVQHGLTIRNALARDMKFICEEADALAMLPGWENSTGARAEHTLAVALRLPIYYLGDRIASN